MTENDAGAKPSQKRTPQRAARSTKTAARKKPDAKAAARATEARAQPAQRKTRGRTAGSGTADRLKKTDEKRRRKTPRVQRTPATRSAPAPESGAQPVRPAPRAPVAAARLRGTEIRPAGGANARTDRQLEAVIKELGSVQTLVRQLTAPPRMPSASAADPILEDAVDSLRRLLSELLEHRMEAVVRDLVEVRKEVAALLTNGSGQTLERLDQLLGSLGAVKFEARRFDAIDPLIHVAVEEQHESGIPGGVILATIRPGFRTGRGFVVCKAAVSVNRGA